MFINYTAKLSPFNSVGTGIESLHRGHGFFAALSSSDTSILPSSFWFSPSLRIAVLMVLVLYWMPKRPSIASQRDRVPRQIGDSRMFGIVSNEILCGKDVVLLPNSFASQIV